MSRARWPARSARPKSVPRNPCRDATSLVDARSGMRNRSGYDVVRTSAQRVSIREVIVSPFGLLLRLPASAAEARMSLASRLHFLTRLGSNPAPQRQNLCGVLLNSCRTPWSSAPRRFVFCGGNLPTAECVLELGCPPGRPPMNPPSAPPPAARRRFTVAAARKDRDYDFFICAD